MVRCQLTNEEYIERRKQIRKKLKEQEKIDNILNKRNDVLIELS